MILIKDWWDFKKCKLSTDVISLDSEMDTTYLVVRLKY